MSDYPRTLAVNGCLPGSLWHNSCGPRVPTRLDSTKISFYHLLLRIIRSVSTIMLLPRTLHRTGSRSEGIEQDDAAILRLFLPGLICRGLNGWTLR